MIAHKKEFTGGFLLFIAFWVVFGIGMSPIYGEGMNILNYMDNLYNTISKKSAYYIPVVKEKTADYQGKTINFTLMTHSSEEAERMAKLFTAGQANVTVDGEKVMVEGDFGLMLDNIISDSESMFANDGTAIRAKYNFSEKQVMYDQWNAMYLAIKDLNKQKKFKEAKIINQVQTKAVEPAYNYYGIQAEDIKSKMGIVVASLGGYVVYTLWFGFSIFFMFEGWGLKIEH